MLSSAILGVSRWSWAELFQYIKARPDLGRSSLQSKFLYIDDGPYWPSLEHLVEHFMRFSYGLPVRLRYPVPPQPKPELPSFATIPRSIPKRTLPAAIDCHVSTIGITKKKESSSMFNTLRLTSPKKALFDMNSLRKCKTKPKRNKSESEVSVGKAHHNTEEFHATAPMLQNLRFFTEFSSVQTDSGGNANPPLGAAAIEFYNVPKNNSAVEPPLPSTLNISTKTEAENEYFTKSDLLITRDRDLNSNGYLPTTDVRFVVDSGEGSQIIKEIGYDRKQTARLDSFISSCSTESEMASYLHRQCNGSFTSENSSTDTNKERFFIQAENIEREGVIGEGEFGSVYKGWLLTRNSTTGVDVRVEVAIKTLRDEHSNKKEFLREASAMIRLQHQCIVQLIGIAKDPENLMMVQELASLGSMLHFIINNSEQIRDCSEFKLWASQIAEGMNYLVSQHFVHRDLAARNILLASRRQAKISDFGMSRSLSTGSDQYTFTQGGKWPLRWYAPESFNNGIFSHASDVWSFGITLWEMWALGKPPYGEISNVDVIKLVDSGQRLPKPDLCPVNIYAIMNSCWNYSPKNRPTFAYLKEFFARTLDYQNLLEMAETVRI
ncbi:tyrosine-protein kinase Shark isoform X2 [Scaptodrosophila lebanonensis]|uniref:Tyrosine-protein kinase Shark isoform X2 n=1 Tax=Drosophila lebanonensis TaxID=7225 RepID=A0A6J2U9B9_DROLE|nr:tyrosine-protein kinase Shark isoform X2 [Scaptodrosophila lebanonensis]